MLKKRFYGKDMYLMKKALIICAAGMSSSMIAQKTTDALKAKGEEIFLEARGVQEGKGLLQNGDYDLYLVSPQTKMYLKELTDLGTANGKKVVPIPPQAYVPIPMGINKMCELVVKEI